MDIMGEKAEADATRAATAIVRIYKWFRKKKKSIPAVLGHPDYFILMIRGIYFIYTSYLWLSLY
jgi:hypothetical protein